MSIRDDQEPTSLFEPLMISERAKNHEKLNDMALELARRSEGFRRSLPEPIISALSDLVRSMNCYYSNLIEGHNTHPIDIERALKNDYSENPQKRNLQLEAKAHIAMKMECRNYQHHQRPFMKSTDDSANSYHQSY